MKCPVCIDGGDLHKFVYGLPADDFDFEKFEVGGCVVYEEMPDYRCRKCDWRGTKAELKRIRKEKS